MKLWAFIVTTTLAAFVPAISQASDTDSLTQTLGEITVTAIKLGNNKATPASITTLSQRDVQRNNITDMKHAAPLMPNFFFPDYGSRMTSTIYVRGVGARIDQPAVGLNIDNIPVICKENYDFDVPDISLIELLHGPQSTLFGRNTMGGVVNIYTLSPRQFHGTKLLLQAATHDSYRAQASHYLSLSSNLDAMAGAFFSRKGGWYTNDYNHKRCGSEQQGGAKVKIDWAPNNDFDLAATASLTHTKQDGYPYQYIETGHIAYNDTCFYRRTALLAGVTTHYRTSHINWATITSYQFLDDNMTLDQDFTPQPYFTLTQARHEHAITQEIVARSNDTNAHYKWLAGLFGFYRRYSMNAPVTFFDAGIKNLIEDHANDAFQSYPITWDSREMLLGSQFKCPTWGIAAYHESSLTLGDFTLTAALRLDHEHTALDYRSTTHTGYSIYKASTGELYAHENIDIDDSGHLSRHHLQLLPKFTLNYALGKHSLFAIVSKGFKAGGFNTQMFSDVLQQRLMRQLGVGAKYDVNTIVGYKPEKSWNYELGTHLKWSTLALDANIFLTSCRDRQLTVFPDGTTTGRAMTNAGRSRNYGAEINARFTPSSSWGINTSYGYTNATFTRYFNGISDYKGKHVPYSPTHTLSAQAYTNIGINAAKQQSLTLAATLNGAGKIYWNEDNTLTQPFYATLAASAKLNLARFSIEIWANNITNTKYNTFYFLSMQRQFLQRGAPHHMGITLQATL